MTLFEALEQLPLSTALKGCGVSMRQYRDARTRDQDFARACDMSMAKREQALLEVVRQATAEDFRAATWLLERTAGADFREVKETETRVKVEIERLLDAVEPHMTSAAYGELVNAIAVLAGGAPVAVKTLPAETEQPV